MHTRENLRNWAISPLNGEFQHNFMAQKLIQMLADAVSHVDDGRQPDEFYWGLTWTGSLMKSRTMKEHWPNHPTWPPTAGYPSPSNDSTRGLKYALTQVRLDSIRWWYNREMYDTANAKGRHKISTGCYGN